MLLTAARGSGHDDLGHFDKHGTFRKKEEEEEAIIPTLYSYRHRKASTSLEVGKPDGQGAGRAGLRSIAGFSRITDDHRTDTRHQNRFPSRSDHVAFQTLSLPDHQSSVTYLRRKIL